MANEHDPQRLWQEQKEETMTITLEDLQHRAMRFERRVHWRNVREYTAGAAVIAALAPQVARFHGWHLAPPVLLILGTLYVLFQLHRRGSARGLPSDAGITASLEFYRREIERQRDALRGIWNWYLLPFAPGLMATIAVAAADHGAKPGLLAATIFFASCFVTVWTLSQRTARKLDRKLEELKAGEA